MTSAYNKDLLVSYLLNELNDEEKRLIEHTLHHNPAFNEELHKLKQVWDKTGLIHEIQSIDIRKEWEVFKKLTQTADCIKDQPTNDKKRTINFKLWLIAASIVIITGISTLLFYIFQMSQHPHPAIPVSYTYFKVPAGQHSQVILPDGTKVWLNARTMLSYANSFGEKDRNISLIGEAFFEVAHNKQFPFHVNTPKISIDVLGTVFNISAYPNATKIETALLSGSISLTDKTSAGRVLINPHEKVTYNTITGKLSIQQFSNDVYSQLKGGEFAFFNEPAEDVFIRLEQFFDLRFSYNPILIQHKRLTARFKKGESLEKILHVTGEALDLKFITQNTTIKVNEYKRKKNNND